MSKDITVSKTIWRKFLDDGTEVHEIQPTECDEYRKNKVQVYVQEGKRKATPTFYVSIEDYTPARRASGGLKAKLASAIEGKDLSTMTASELLALIG